MKTKKNQREEKKETKLQFMTMDEMLVTYGGGGGYWIWDREKCKFYYVMIS